MNNLSSYYGLVDTRISASGKIYLYKYEAVQQSIISHCFSGDIIENMTGIPSDGNFK